jgi:hypothetical protein
MTPPSFVDDGLSFDHRLPQNAHGDINRWLHGTLIHPSASHTTATSAYTGSFIDDGADMLVCDEPAEGPGFGKIDKRFYSTCKRRGDKEQWTEEMARAVGGDVQQSLGIMGELDRIRIVDSKISDIDIGKAERMTKSASKKEVGKQDEDGGIWIVAPPVWGTFIIEGQDGRVVIVDEDGEYDSGPPRGTTVNLERRRSKKFEEKMGVEAAPSLPCRLAFQNVGLHNAQFQPVSFEDSTTQNKGLEQKKNRRRRGSLPSAKPLTPVQEANSTDEISISIVASDIASPTKLFMTSGASGGPSPVSSPIQPPASPALSPPSAWLYLLPSPVKPGLEGGWGTGSPAGLEPRPAGQSVDMRTEHGIREGSLSRVETASSGESSRLSQTRSSRHSAAHLEAAVEGDAHRTPGIRTGSDHSFASSVISHSFKADSRNNCSWKQDMEEFYSRVSTPSTGSHAASTVKSNTPWIYQTSLQAPSAATITAAVEQTWEMPTSINSKPSSHSSKKTSTTHTPSFSAWDAHSAVEQGSNHTHSPCGSSARRSRVSTIQPYSWRRDVAEQSTYSTQGSSRSRSDAEPDAWEGNDMDKDSWVHNGDARSTRSTHSTYHHPTVEDVPETPGEEAGKVKDSTSGGAKDRSGYSEDNETWLNSEMAGVKYREASWRRPGGFSWRDS